MFKVFITDKLSEKGVAVFKAEPDFQADVYPTLAPEELKKAIVDYDALVIRSATNVTPDILEAAKKLKVVGRAGVGLDNVDIPAATRRGVIVMNTPDGNTISAAEHTVALILAMARNIPQAHASLKDKKWERNKFTGIEIFGKTLGVIGLGRIGFEVAKRLRAFNMNVLAYDPFCTPERARTIDAELTTVEDILKRADIITVHVPKTKETANMIAAEQIRTCKKGVRFVNVARGGIINEADLAQAIKDGQVAGAAIDVFTEEPPTGNPLLELDKVVLTPHLGASTEEAQVNVADVVAKQIVDALRGRTIANAVNIPSISAEQWKEIQPFYQLAGRLGAFAAQYAGKGIKSAEIHYRGAVARQKPQALTPVLLKELLSVHFPESVNLVNAPVLAAERGIAVKEIMSGEGTFTTSIALKLVTPEGEVNLEAALSGDEPRIVSINGFRVDIRTSGTLLLSFNKDVPGMVGRVGTVLGEAGVNIASLTNGRGEKGGEALSVFSLDQGVAESVLKKIEAIAGLRDVRLVHLG
jgi:D-3-phosphoglycerate dehydrogenase